MCIIFDVAQKLIEFPEAQIWRDVGANFIVLLILDQFFSESDPVICSLVAIFYFGFLQNTLTSTGS